MRPAFEIRLSDVHDTYSRAKQPFERLFVCFSGVFFFWLAETNTHEIHSLYQSTDGWHGNRNTIEESLATT